MNKENINLEAVINKISFEIVNEKILDENQINKLLGVLASNGVYAMWVYALDKLEFSFKENPEELRKIQVFALLEKISKLDYFITKNLNFDKLIERISNLTKEIKNLNVEIKSLKKKQKEQEKKNKENERNKLLNEYFINISQDIHKLLFLKQVLEETLIYARYHAKA